uniref:PyrC7 n=1 Tax=Streptomyces rugosporus TaxID=295838 RepID=K7QSI9_STRRG|nr:PyrC7 [Streptomyces rugosporus]
MPWPTHYFQMVGAVWALIAAGHEVRVAGPPGLLGAVTSTGVTAVPVGGGYDVMDGVAEMVKARKRLDRGAHMVGAGDFSEADRRALLDIRMVPHLRLAEDLAPGLVAFAKAWRPDIVLADPLVYAAPLAAAAVGAPVVRHLWGPDLSRQIALPGSGVDPADDPRAAWPAELVALYEKYDAEPRADLADLTLDNCPTSMQLPGIANRVDMRYVPYNGAMVAPAWLQEPPERPRVCVTWGTSTTKLAGDDAFLVPQILQALAPFDVEVVVAVRPEDRARLGDFSDDVRIVENVPLNLFLPSCRAIVHSSSGGTALTAALYGLPQVVLPTLGGEAIIYERLCATGAGLGLKPDEVGESALTAAVDAVLHDGELRAAAGRLQAEMLSQAPPSAVVPVLENLV